MESGSKKREKGSEKCVGEGRDRLSELPDEVLVHILSFLPTVDAVRTLLLRRFRKLWTLLPSLDFSDTTWTGSFSASKLEAKRFSRFVRNVLILHKTSTIEEFRLEIRRAKVSDDVVQMWIQFALDREAKNLILLSEYGIWEPSYLPNSLFTCQSLVSLTLEHCEIQVPSRVLMGSLTTLTLIQVTVLNANGLNNFVSGCPSLQGLVVHRVGDVRISSPSIVNLTFDFMDQLFGYQWAIDCSNLKVLDICVDPCFMHYLDVPSIRQVTINFYGNGYIGEDDFKTFKRFLKGFRNAEVVTFQEKVDEYFTCCSEVNMEFSRNRWKRIVLNSEIQEPLIALICGLVKSSPWLEELVIHVIQSRRIITSEELVTMHGYAKPYEGQLRLAEFLLKSAVNLDKLVIFSNHESQLSCSKELQFVKQLSNYPRASTKARIVFEVQDCNN